MFRILLVIALLAPGFCAGEETGTDISLMPLWVPQAQFAGYYAADEKGIYSAHGLKVAILDGGPSSPPARMIESGRARCGIMFLANGILEKARGLPIVNVAQIVQRSALMLVARASSGIRSPKDLEGKKVGLWGAEFEVQAQALFRKYGVHVHKVPQALTVNLFLRGGVDVVSAMWHNEYHVLLNSGLEASELSVLPFDQYGLNFPEDGIYCSAGYVEENPEKICEFVKASLEGWDYAFANPEETLNFIMKKTEKGNWGTNKAHQRWMLARMKDLIYPPSGNVPGTLREDDYMRVSAQLAASGAIDKAPSLEDFRVDCREGR